MVYAPRQEGEPDHATGLSAWSLFDQTDRVMESRFGVLTIEGGGFYAELYTRAAELSRQSITLTESTGLVEG